MEADKADNLDLYRYFVETDWLAERLADPQLRLIDLRYYWDKPGIDAYQEGHIPGAVHLHWDKALSDRYHRVRYMLLLPEDLEKLMGSLGVDNTMTVVAYDDEGGHYSSRLWYTLNYYSFDNIKILHGGILKWKAENRPLSTETPLITAKTFKTGTPRPEWRVNYDQVLQAIGDPQTVIVDVRRPSEYSGEEMRTKRGGHVPGAVNLLWLDNLNREEWTFKDAATLRHRFEQAGVTPDKQVITYCHGGVRAAHAALVFKMLGYSNVTMYDGSWEEWGNHPTLPIETSQPEIAQPEAVQPDRAQ